MNIVSGATIRVPVSKQMVCACGEAIKVIILDADGMDFQCEAGHRFPPLTLGL